MRSDSFSSPAGRISVQPAAAGSRRDSDFHCKSKLAADVSCFSQQKHESAFRSEFGRNRFGTFRVPSTINGSLTLSERRGCEEETAAMMDQNVVYILA